MEFAYGVIPCRKRNQEWKVLMVFDRHGNWGFPKGHVEENESPLQAAKRELLEETGLAVKEWLPSPELITSYTYDGNPKEVGFFLAVCKGRAKAHPPEVTKVKWVPLSKVESLATFDQTKNLLPLIEHALN
jgi:tRNA nucleotidyltransferase (CCA-adding enzyme)